MKAAVEKIICDIIQIGEKALSEYSIRFDGEDYREIGKAEIQEAYSSVDDSLINAIQKAKDNISAFAKMQMPKGFEMKTDYGIIGQKIIPLQRVGCYVPGGRYPLVSSVLMSVIPAKVAGVKEVIVCCPKIRPEVIVAADIAGADRIFSIGGVQAIAAMAFGIGMVPKVDKIVGPGNAYVAEAKRQVFGEVGIDFIAGPSEVMIIGDFSCEAKLVAADLLAQAEHDVNARSVFLCDSATKMDEVKKELKRQMAGLSTKEVAEKAKIELKLVSGMKEAMDIANKEAPEHLELQIKDAEEIVDYLYNYGSLFLGRNSAEVFGDYCSGPNHILPTGGAARYTGGLGVKDFVKFVTYQNLSDVDEIAEVSIKLAEAEGLDGHKKAAEVRLKSEEPFQGLRD